MISTTDKNNGFNYEYLKDPYIYDKYLDSEDEIYARLNTLRWQLNLDPKHFWTIEEIRALKIHPKYDPDELDLDRYTDDFLLHLFNEVAANNLIDSTNYNFG